MLLCFHHPLIPFHPTLPSHHPHLSTQNTPPAAPHNPKSFASHPRQHIAPTTESISTQRTTAKYPSQVHSSFGTTMGVY
ncbi:hypothetical protein L207DRAFT_505905 [Hyaloscypha variabilis F]|uniref:Uncharacterized protein n=1 Tax=Hyaloscypha variabilis (strain UAMH 11265 / GT02V1 / F) TaxID=1149755 RepID=A0A2J6SDS0_HYAVF|nr:hypothetical protein L207DRAFT_505905 [Hyaloscypha variabilis F]